MIRKVLARARAADIRTYIEDLLVELCRVDTTPRADVAQMRSTEQRCFDILERELRALRFTGARLERRLINPAMENHPSYSLPHFTKTPRRPEGLSAEDTYAGRSNLLFILPGVGAKPSGSSVALNVHIDVVAPYFPPRARRGIVFGRGACDDKGPVVSMVVALRVLSVVMAKAGIKWNRNVVAMFVVEEETGGNGSLSLAMDRGLKRLYDSVLVGECTGLKVFPANRGAVWYRTELKPPPDGAHLEGDSGSLSPPERGEGWGEGNLARKQGFSSPRLSPPFGEEREKMAEVSAFEMFAFVNEELEKEGAAIRAESRHDLFPQRPVQTCHGIIGPFGEHPSRICGEVAFDVKFARRPGKPAEALVRDCLEAGLNNYIGLYGDKSKTLDPATGKPMVARHYDVRRRGNGFEVAVHGATGHMGAIRERDGAITKMAHLVRSLSYSVKKLTVLGGAVRFELGGKPVGQSLILEGGQGFVPTHGIEEVMDRLRRAAERGAENYLRRCGRKDSGKDVVTVTYDKLHNAAFDGDPASPAMLDALAAARRCGIRQNEPVCGWTVSCDARLFAGEYPGMPVLTFGPGELAHAHSDHEQIAVDDIRKAAEFLAVFLLRHTGTSK